MDSSSEGAVYNFYLVEVYYTTLRVTRVTLKCEKESFSRKGPNFTKRTKETGIGLAFTDYFIMLKVK